MGDKRHILMSKLANKTARPLGFTLVELLTVLAIIGILAAVSVPVLKNFGKSDVSVSASRQLLDDVGRARQLAMSQRTTVYMVFVPTNFWLNTAIFQAPSSLATIQQLSTASNLLGMQLAGYTFMAYGALGDQPGNHQWHYLASWQTLPAGAYIPLWKFYNPNGTPSQPYVSFSDPVNAGVYFNINTFATNLFPFPTEDSSNPVVLPYIAFNYLGQLSSSSGQLFTPNPQNGPGAGDGDFAGGGIDIPIAQGSLLYGRNGSSRAFLVGSPQVIEMPPGNSTNLAYNVVHIDPLTGRATLEYHKIQ
jgi:prepilin-type N-terminal cleavage/methylation domain-containing protein